MSGTPRRGSMAGRAREFIARTIVAWYNSPEERRRREDALRKGAKILLQEQGDIPTELGAYWRWLAWMKAYADRATQESASLLPDGLVTVGVTRFVVGIGDWLLAYSLAAEAITLQMPIEEALERREREAALKEEEP